ncbi:hypothetical protein SEPCBS119000_004354 [Sporothrix epigloea]|uniref:Ars-binding protein n=1 Tax=Sporothrix epigloea TaxID=1892477 RepID=A0ABP0DUK1_9PEZI
MSSTEELRPTIGSQPLVMLPDRIVTATNIDSVYVSFILACNPAVSPSTDTTALREAFRTPPRSDGKSFSTFLLYQLICQLEARKIKTWAELALNLGVEPPDQDKGQSSQKIQQYAVRLKIPQRWMHSMHVDAFFDYLMDRPHPYWTHIPTALSPLDQHLRDGVAAKDDMALRALVPEIKPRRGRRRPDDDEHDVSGRRSSPQRQRLDGYADDPSIPDLTAGRWPAQADGTRCFDQRQLPRYQLPDAVPGRLQIATPMWSADDPTQPSLTTCQQSLIVPSTQICDHVDETPSVTVPVSSRKTGRRHGAKVVSSAWRSGGSGAAGRIRGRPPIHRNGNHRTSPPANTQDIVFPQTLTAGSTPSIHAPTVSAYPPYKGRTVSAPLQSLATNEHLATDASSGQKNVMITGNLSSPALVIQPHGLHPSNTSWQLPPRQRSEVRSISPTMLQSAGALSSAAVTGHAHDVHDAHVFTPIGRPMPSSLLPKYGSTASELSDHHNQTPSLVETYSSSGGVAFGSATTTNASATPEPALNVATDIHSEASNFVPEDGSNVPRPMSRPQPVYSVQFGSGIPGDRTNIDEIEAFFMTEIIAAIWLDENDQRIPPGSVEEASVLVDVVIEDLVKGASCKEAFLINLAALAGGKILMSDTETRIKRLERTADYTKYDFSWELRFGNVCGQFSITEVVEHARWKTMTTDIKASVARAVGLKTEAEERAQQPLADLLSGITASEDGGRIRLPPTQTVRQTVWPGDVPQVNPGLQRFAPDGSADFHFGTPAGSQNPAADGSNRASITGSGTTPGGATASALDDSAELAAIWEKKYRHLLHLLYKRDRQLDRTRYAVLQGIRKTYEHDDTREEE